MRALLTLVALLVLLAGCGDEGGVTTAAPGTATATPDAAEPVKAFSDFQDLESGRRYVTGVFEPPVAITVPDGAWASDTGDLEGHFAIAATDPPEPLDQAILGVHRMTTVYDPEKGGRIPGDQIAFEGDFAAWLRDHPHLRATKPKEVSLLGLKGVQLDVTGKSSPPTVPDDCGKVGDNCVPMFYDGLDWVMYSSQGRGRFTVLELPDGPQLVVEQYVEPETAFDEGLALLEPLLAGLELG